MAWGRPRSASTWRWRSRSAAGALDPVEPGFDLVLYDTPAGLGAVTRAALARAHFALVPFSFLAGELEQGMERLSRAEAREDERPQRELL